MIAFDSGDIHRRCGYAAAEAGRRYHAKRQVVAFDWAGDTIRSAVQGTDARPYRQTITVKERKGRLSLVGTCSCPVETNCKHVAAALFEGLVALAEARAAAERTPERRLARLTGAVPQPAWRPPEPDPAALSGALADWLVELDRAVKTVDEDYPPGINQRIVYLLMPLRDEPRMPYLGVQTVTAKLGKDGRLLPDAKPYSAHRAPASNGPKYLRPSDERIMRDLVRMPTIYDLGCQRLVGEAGAEVLAAILQTGRARWLAVAGPALAAGPARHGTIAWAEAEGGALLPRLAIEEPGVLLAATPPVYVDPDAGLVGPVETGQPARVAAALFRAPPVAPLAIAALNESLAKRLPALAGLTPPTPVVERRAGLAPVPRLRLFLAPTHGPQDGVFDRQGVSGQVASAPVALARLSFRYGDAVVPLGETKPTVSLLAAGRLVAIERDGAAEATAALLLLERGFAPASELRPDLGRDHARDLLPAPGAEAWYHAVSELVPELRRAGWDVEMAADFPYRVLRAEGDLDAELHQTTGIDWLELHLGVMVEGERVDLVGPIVALISSPDFSMQSFAALAANDDKPVFLPLSGGRVLSMPMGRLRPIIEGMRDLAFGLERDGNALRLSMRDAARLFAFEAATAGAALRWRGGEAIRDLGRRLAAAGGIPPVAVPPGFLATLRPYQAEGVAWLSLLREVGLGGILADDMGLGKTVQALAFLTIEKAAGRLDRPALVVAPTSLMGNWAREAERFAPDLRVLTLHGVTRKALFDAIPDHDLVLTTYPLVARDRAVLAAQAWHVLLLDEAQTIKNPDAATTKLVLSLDARHRFCLTGTPLENNLAELWSLFSFACPGLLGDRKRFTIDWRTPIEKTGNPERARLLARRVRPFLLRRTKAEVARDLPPKTEMVERIAFEAAQRDVYETIRLSMHQRIRKAIEDKGWAKSRIVVLDALLKLRQACCDPRLLKLKTRAGAAAGSAKLDRLEEMLRELLAEGRRVIVFSQFTSMLDLIRPRLDAAGIPYSLLTGSTRDRPAAIAAFDSGVAQVFLISLKAGGLGLNLVSADTVVLYDPWWNPAVESQAIDRAHRIGQTRPVFVHKLVAAGTIEEKMEVLKEKKSALAASLFDADGEPTLAMTEDDIEMLLAS